MIFLTSLFGTLWVFALTSSAQDAHPAVVSGVIRVEKAKVKTGGRKSFRDVVVYLEPEEPRTYPAPAEHEVMDQRGLTFIPHVLAVQKNTTVEFLNSDNDRHNVYFLYDKTGDTLDIGTWGPGQTVSHIFKDSGLVITLCQLHLEMAAYIQVLDTPFFTVARIDGKTQSGTYEISGVPPGNYELRAWHKKLKMKGGGIKFTVAAGNNQTVDIVITKKKYAK